MLLAQTKEILISKALKDSNISDDELISVNNVLKKYYDNDEYV